MSIWSRTRISSRRALEKIAHLFICGLAEIGIRAANGIERLGRYGTHDFIRSLLKFLACFGGRSRDGDDYPCGPLLPDGRNRGFHCGSRCKPVIYNDDDPAFDWRRSSFASVQPLAPLQFILLVGCHAIDHVRRNAELADDSIVKDADTAGG